MADPKDRTFTTDEAKANRAQGQGLGYGQSEMDAQRSATRSERATNPEQRSFRGDMEAPTNADRPGEADFGLEGAEGRDGGKGEGESRRGPDPDVSRNAADMDDVRGDLGAGTPPNVDVHKLGQDDRPQEDWGEPADEGAVFSSNHTRRAERTEAERGQGNKTRQANKDIVSRRG